MNYKPLSARQRKALLGDKLTQAIDAFGREQTAKTTGDLCAEILGRVTSLITAAELRALKPTSKREAAQNGSD